MGIYLFICSFIIILKFGQGFNLYHTALYLQPSHDYLATTGLNRSASERQFGLSLSFYRKRFGDPLQLLVGAPRDAIKYINHPTYSGKMFACGIEQLISESSFRSSVLGQASITSLCLPHLSVADALGSGEKIMNETDQHLGFTLDSMTTSDNSVSVVCGHKSSYFNATVNRTFSTGACFVDQAEKRESVTGVPVRKRRERISSDYLENHSTAFQSTNKKSVTHGDDIKLKSTHSNQKTQKENAERSITLRLNTAYEADMNETFYNTEAERTSNVLMAERLRRSYDDNEKSGNRDWKRITPFSSNPKDMIVDSGRYKHTRALKMAYSQHGTSLHVTGKGNIVMGTPGIWFWSGGVYIWKNDTMQCQLETDLQYADDYNYLGFSVTSTTMRWPSDPEKEDVELYISGVPRRDNTGRVLVFSAAWESCSTNDSMKILQVLSVPEVQMGSFYGWSVLVEDVNGDGMGDLFVGAPFYNHTSGDEGAVFVYMRPTDIYGERNQYPNNYTLLLGRGVSPGARFGNSMASAGDINLDGFNDVVIGAPFDDNGVGAVYLYMGGAKGLFIKPNFIQKFKPKLSDTGIRSFGFSIASHPADIDSNGYPDLAVGAFMSGMVTLIRSRPVHTVTVDIKFSTHLITWPRPHCSTGRHPDGMTEYDVIVTFHYNVPARQMGSGANLLTINNTYLSGISKGQSLTLTFLDRADLALELSVQRCQAVGWVDVAQDCVSLELIDRTGFYVGTVEDEVQAVSCGSKSSKSRREDCSFISRLNHFENGTFAFESVSRRGYFLGVNSSGHLSLLTKNQRSLNNAAFYLKPSKIFQGLTGISYNLSVDALKISQGQLPTTQLLHKGRLVSNIIGQLDFSTSDLLRPKTLTWRAAFTNVTRNVLTPPLVPILYEITIKQENNDADQSSSDKVNSNATVQTPLLNKLASNHFFRQMELFNNCGNDSICQPNVTLQLFDTTAAAFAADGSAVSTASFTTAAGAAEDVERFTPSPIIVGSIRPISLFVVLFNDGEPADHMDMTVRHPVGLRYRQAQAVNCSGQIVTCTTRALNTYTRTRAGSTDSPRTRANSTGLDSGLNVEDHGRQMVNVHCGLSEPLYDNVTLIIQFDFEPIDETYKPRGEPVTFGATVIARTAHANHTTTAQNLTRPIKYDGSLLVSSDPTSEYPVAYAKAPVEVSHKFKIFSAGPGVSQGVSINVQLPLCPYPDSSIVESLNITVKYLGRHISAVGEESVKQISDDDIRCPSNVTGNCRSSIDRDQHINVSLDLNETMSWRSMRRKKAVQSNEPYRTVELEQAEAKHGRDAEEVPSHSGQHVMSDDPSSRRVDPANRGKARDTSLKNKRSTTDSEKAAGISLMKCNLDKAKGYHIGSMDVGTEVQISINLRLFTDKIIASSWKEVHVLVESLVEVMPATTTHDYDYQPPSKTKHIIAKAVKTTVKPSLDSAAWPLWIIALIGFGIGFLVLIILLIILYKCGFFRRRRVMETLKEEQEEDDLKGSKNEAVDGAHGMETAGDGDSVGTKEKGSLDRSFYDMPGEQNNIQEKISDDEEDDATWPKKY